MTEHQKTREHHSHGSRAVCADCGTIYDPRHSTHSAEECTARQAALDADSEAPE
jgi:hypothetical protein